MCFEKEIEERIIEMSKNFELKSCAHEFMKASLLPKYSYNFSWLDRPIIQYPQDIVAMQELIWQTKPDLIIETGIAHGGSLIMNASMLAMLDMCDAIESGTMFDPCVSSRKVVGIDIDIRAHNRAAIEAHPMISRIDLLEGSSIDQDIIDQVKNIASRHKRVLVCLDSNHTHDHVLAELRAYAPLVSINSYCVVFDTIIEDIPGELSADRLWAPGNNPKTAVREYLSFLNGNQNIASDGSVLNFEVNQLIENKLLISVAPSGYLRRI